VCNLFCLAPILDTAGRRLLLIACRDLLDGTIRANWTSKVDPFYKRGKQLEELPDEFRYADPDEAYSSSRARKIRLSQVDYSFESEAAADAALTDTDEGLYIYIAELAEFFKTYTNTEGAFVSLQCASIGKDLGVIGEGGEVTYLPTATTLYPITRTEYDGLGYGVRLDLDEGATPPDNQGPRICSAYYADMQTPLHDGDVLDTPIFLIWRGLTDIREEGAQVPYAGAAAYDYHGNLFGDMSLLWTGETGLYAVWWERWITALRAMRVVNYAIRLNASDLANLDWTAKIRIDRHAYFVKRVQVTLTTDDILPATIELMQIN